MEERHIYIIGSKGIPAKYGGFETFVEKLTEYKKDSSIKYHIACTQENSEKSEFYEKHFEYNEADCFNIKVPNIGPAKAIYYDIASLNYAIDLAVANKNIRPIFYVLACRIGPFIKRFKKKISNIGGVLYVNPDGHEWLREKWSLPVRKYWKLSEKLMVKNSDLLICDSKSIESYINNDYAEFKPKTSFISYGTDTKSPSSETYKMSYKKWCKKFEIKKNNYFLIVGRFVPENNLELIIKEFMKSKTNKDLVIISNVENNNFYKRLSKLTRFYRDSRIKFVGTVYNQDVLKEIRRTAYAYIHGHEVGGTNPSLLEAMAFTNLNLLLDVGFNREVGRENTLYFNKNQNNLSRLIDNVCKNRPLQLTPRKEISERYTWDSINRKYEKIFLTEGKN